MKITLTIDDAEMDGLLKDALSQAVKSIARDEMQAIVHEEVLKISSNRISQTVDDIPKILRTEAQKAILKQLSPDGKLPPNGEIAIKEHVQQVFNMAFPPSYIELILTGRVEATLEEVARKRIAQIENQACKDVLEEHKNTIRDNLKAFVNRV